MQSQTASSDRINKLFEVDQADVPHGLITEFFVVVNEVAVIRSRIHRATKIFYGCRVLEVFEDHHIDEVQAFSATLKESGLRIEHVHMHISWIPALFLHVGPATQNKSLLQATCAIDLNFLVNTAEFQPATNMYLNLSQRYTNPEPAVRIAPTLGSCRLRLRLHQNQT